MLSGKKSWALVNTRQNYLAIHKCTALANETTGQPTVNYTDHNNFKQEKAYNRKNVLMLSGVNHVHKALKWSIMAITVASDHCLRNGDSMLLAGQQLSLV